MYFSPELQQVMELGGMALGLVLTVMILLISIGFIAARFIGLRL
jgi:hypothetical protein